MLAFAMAAFTFTSCEDVPAPYEMTGGGNGGGGSELPEGTFLDQDFSSSLGQFTSVSASGDIKWAINYSSACITGYADWDGSGTKTNHAGVTYLVSPEIDLTNATAAHVAINHAMRYERADINTNNSLVITDNYTGDVNTTTWTQLNYGTTGLNGSTFDFVDSEANIPAAMMGKKVHLAMRHTCTDAQSSTWEVKTLKVLAGEASTPSTPDTPDTPVTGKNLLENGDFEAWANGLPTNWKSASTAGNATLSQSTDAHSGKAAVLVKGATQNKRMAYKEVGLKAGDYTVTFYVKAADAATGGSVRPGVVPVVDGKVGSYAYGDYVNDLTASWTEVKQTLNVPSDGTYCFVVMNSAKPGGDVIIDDFSVTTTNGGLTDGGSTEEPDQPSTDGIFSESFASGVGSFTIKDTTLPDGLTYVWNFASSYSCMKGSAYANGTTYAADSYLVSPKIDLSKVSDATLTFDQAINQIKEGKVADCCRVYVSTDYAGDVAKANWTQIAVNDMPAGTSWTFGASSASLKAFAGKTIYIAFRYTSSSTVAPTWEVKNVVVK